ncbi:helix-turn-helix domain-containing protein [Bacillus sp. EAC]|uniref:AlbA family DNA-binding domain-containing protein n=1 Tax=Bacillus sp. EAC TaxID=1978338 RepID=UPI000B438D89|nr:ATP-binding protein [Bacillus sp. EAC]
MVKRPIYKQEFLNTFNNEDKIFDIASLKSLIEQSFGENNALDFKETFIREDHIAKLIVAMANSGGGSIIFGVNDDNQPVGLIKEELKDPTDFQRKLNGYLPSILNYNLQQIEYDENEIYGYFSGKTFFIIYIPEQNRFIPFIAKRGSDKLFTDKIYIRKNTSIETATNEDLEMIFKKRLIEQYEDLSNMSLNEHMEQLKILYSISANSGDSIKNEKSSKENFGEFIARMIEKKKRKIEIVLEVSNIE